MIGKTYDPNPNHFRFSRSTSEKPEPSEPISSIWNEIAPVFWNVLGFIVVLVIVFRLREWGWV